jgi:mono/diheme cytochrome c family protein
MGRLVPPLLAGVLAAVAAFAVTASLDDEDAGSPPAAARSATASPAADGRATFNRMGCGSCHQLAAAGATGEIGPSLDERLPGHTRASLRAVIVNPPRYSPMPDDFGARLEPGELDALVDFLLASRPQS